MRSAEQKDTETRAKDSTHEDLGRVGMKTESKDTPSTRDKGTPTKDKHKQKNRNKHINNTQSRQGVHVTHSGALGQRGPYHNLQESLGRPPRRTRRAGKRGGEGTSGGGDWGRRRKGNRSIRSRGQIIKNLL